MTEELDLAVTHGPHALHVRVRAGLRYARRALEIREDYSRELEAALDAREAELREREREALAAESERAWLRERADTLAAIQAGGWWRLRGRLLPLIRLAGRLRRQALSLLSSHAQGRDDGL